MITRTVTWAIGAVLLLLLALWAYNALTRDAKTEAKLGRNQAEAASEAGRGAVNTVATAGARETDGEELTRSNEKEIRNAEGADAQVHGAARDAGLNSLCRRAAYRSDPRCVSRVHPGTVEAPR